MNTKSMTGGAAIAGLMLAMALSVPCLAQHRNRDQGSAPRRENHRSETMRAPRQERSVRENSPRSYREYRQPGRMRQENPRQTPQGSRIYPGSRGYSSVEPGRGMNRPQSPASGYAQRQRDVARPPSQRPASRYIQQPRREVPRPPSQGQPRSPGPASSYGQQQRREVARPPSQVQPRQPNQNPAYAQQPREVPRPPQAINPQGRVVPRPPQQHGGDWLRSHRELSPADQQKALLNDPTFRKLPAPQQQRLENRLQHFNSLPRDEQQRRLNRIETWEHLTSQQKTQARQLASQWKDLTPQRKQMMKNAIGDLRTMPPDQRDQVLESPRFKSMFSDQERNMLRETTKLPLAPAQPTQ